MALSACILNEVMPWLSIHLSTGNFNQRGIKKYLVSCSMSQVLSQL